MCIRDRVGARPVGGGGLRLRGADQGDLEGRDERRGDGATGQGQGGDQADDQAGAGAGGGDDGPERRPGREDGEGDTELGEVETGDLARLLLRQRTADDDDRRADHPGQVHAHEGVQRLPGVDAGVVLGFAVLGERAGAVRAAGESEERGDEQQHRCSDHHAVTSSEGADVHVRVLCRFRGSGRRCRGARSARHGGGHPS